MRKIHCVFIIALLLISCGTSKEVTAPVKTISRNSFEYIDAFHAGLRFKAKGQIELALDKFNYCLSIRKDDDAVYYALSQIYIQKQAYSLSATAIQKAFELDPSNIWYLQELAYMNYETKNFKEATINFKELLKRSPNSVDWLYGYSECLLQLGKVNDAIKALDKTEDQVGVHPDLSIKKYYLYIELKEPEKAIQEINKAREVFPNYPNLLAILVDHYFQQNQEGKAIEMLAELAKADPTNGRVHMGLADIYQKQGRKKEAYQELKLGFNCTDVDLDAKMKVLISIHEESINIDPLVYELVEMVVAKHPEDSKAHSIHGDYLLRAEQSEEALKAYKEALKYTNSEYAIWNQVLLMEYQFKQFEALYEDSKKCSEYFPTIASVYLFNGIAANQLKKTKEAIAALEAAKDLVINDKPLEAEIYSQLGSAYFTDERVKDGSRMFELSLDLDPNNTLNLNNFAYRLAQAKSDLEKAEKLINRANNLLPNQAHFIDTYGFVFFQKGEYTKAKEFFIQAYELNSSDPIITEHLGDAYIKNGEPTKALEFWKAALEKGATNKNLSKKIETKKYYEPSY